MVIQAQTDKARFPQRERRMKYEILLLGKTKDSFLADGIKEYEKRLKHYTSVALKTIKTRRFQGSDDSIREKEGELLLASLMTPTFLVTLDSRGKELSSTSFSKAISQWEQQNIRHITFIIGGPLGLARNVLEKADFSLSLSQMTFTHDMVRLFLLEQLYRAYTIKAGEQYHK